MALGALSDNEEKYKRLMAGDFSDYNDDLSRADMGLVNILSRKFHNDIWKIADAWLASPLYREKLERSDYRSSTILKAIKGEPVFDTEDEDSIEDNGVDKWVVEPLDKYDGWFPAREVSLVGGGSGSGKTYWVMSLLEKSSVGADFLGHKTVARDYRVLMHDRGVGAMRRTLSALGLSDVAKKKIFRLSSKQQSCQPADVLEAIADANPGVEVFFIEGLDFWFPDVLKMKIVGPILDALHRVATRRNIAVIATVGAPKEKTTEGKATARYYGRDALFGSAALARKADTVVLISKTDEDNENAPRQYTICKRNGGQERFWMAFENDHLIQVDRPLPEARAYKGPPSKADATLRLTVFAKFKPGERILYSKDLGTSEKTYYAWVKNALEHGIVEERSGHRGGYFIPQCSA